MSDETRQLAEEQFRELVKELEAGRSEKLTQFLLTSERFHTYSWCNVLLIACQSPGATRVAGYQTWRRLDRQVRKGEKGIAILAPIVRRMCRFDADAAAPTLDDEPNQTKMIERVIAFRRVFVFDIAQTDGAPLPTLEERATGDPGPISPSTRGRDPRLWRSRPHGCRPWRSVGRLGRWHHQSARLARAG